MALVKNTNTRKGLLIIMFGAGIAMLMVLWNMDVAPLENHTQPQASGINQSPDQENGTTAKNNSSQPSDQQKHVAITPPDSTNLPRLDETPSTVESNSADSSETPFDKNKIYTMATLPQDKSGVYWVKDSDGSVNRIAGDVPGPDSPMGL